MDAPRVDGYEVQGLHDHGGCGQVFRAMDKNGEHKALKVFDDLSVSRTLLAKMGQRMRADGWPQGVMPWELEHLDRSPLYVVMPWMADDIGGVEWRPRSLQHQMDSIDRKQAWKVIRLLADSLAQMHARHVPHGNLKPGNVFMDADGGVWVSDWCLGNMPGVHVFHFTDALLYQPPEQLLDTSGYLDEQGYGWDVFAFGVLAYRLLTGSFPRCHAVFSKVAPSEGVTRCEGLKADPEKLANNLRAKPDIEWPDHPVDELERRMREWIERCLDLDPSHRPASMNDVCAGFELVTSEVERENEVGRLQRHVAWGRRVTWFLLAVIAGLLVLVSMLNGMRKTAESTLAKEQQLIGAEREDLKMDVAAAVAARDAARQSEAEAKLILEQEREDHLAQVSASRLVGDRLFAWAMEKGRRMLPPLDERDVRLQRLENYFKAFLEESEGIPELAGERARVQLQLAEIAISEGDVPVAVSRLDASLESWESLPKDTRLMMRVATNRLMIATLRADNGDPQALAAFKRAREALASVPRDRVDADRLDQLLAVLDFREAKLVSAAGDEQRALEQLMRATKTLNRISSRRPDVAILRSALADCYLSSASILEGMGSMGDAREVRKLAAEELERLYAKDPTNMTIQFELASCFASMAEAAILSGDIEEAGRRSRDALKLLDGFLNQRPRDDEALDRKASLLGLQAGIHRDRGEVDKALALYDEAMRMLEAIHDRRPEHAMATYHLALICWQKGRMSGLQGRGGDIVLMRKASLLMGQLVGDGDGPRPEQLMRSRAYLAGDLGHAFELKDQADMAKLAFGDSVERWQELLKMRPGNEEYQQGLEWCLERLKEKD